VFKVTRRIEVESSSCSITDTIAALQELGAAVPSSSRLYFSVTFKTPETFRIVAEFEEAGIVDTLPPTEQDRV
jgi:hypothetical protein